MNTHEGRMDAFKFLLPAIQRISDKLERAAIANDVAGYLGVDPGMVLDQFKRSAVDRRPAKAAAARMEVPALERILLNALLSSPEACAEVIPRLTPETIASLTAREVFEAVVNMWTAGAPLTVSALSARLSEPAQALLHEMAAADEMGEDMLPLEQARACLQRLEEAAHKRKLGELRSAIKTAEREGRWQEALDLTAELGRWQRKLEGGESR
jgi:DNA primase